MNILSVILAVPAQTTAAEEFVKVDPFGVGMAVMAMTVVMVVLAISAIVFQNIDNLIHFFTKLFTKRKQTATSQPSDEKVTSSGEELAAISMALHLFQSELHDQESLTLTINKISKTYSPWSSKIYGIMNNAVNRKTYSK